MSPLLIRNSKSNWVTKCRIFEFPRKSILQHRKKGIDDVPYFNRLIKFDIKGLEMLNSISRTVKNGWMLVMYIFSLKTMPETPKEANSMM